VYRFCRRHPRCKTGIAGLWQVSGRNCLTYSERRELDLEFVRRRSLRLYLRILLHTIPEVFTGSTPATRCQTRISPPLRNFVSGSALPCHSKIGSSMQKRISPASAITGSIALPGDKSISHRYAMIAAIAEGETRIANYSTGADCHSTLGCVQALGIPVAGSGTEFVIHGRGLDGLRPPAADLDAGNSGSTMRMLSGILAAQPFASRIFGDESLSRRPMQRIMKPLAEMGARIHAREDKFPPLVIQGGTLRPIEYALPVPSAQVKTCVLFAGLFAEGETSVLEPVRSRDHTEIALREFGADLTVARNRITVAGRPKLTGRPVVVPSDLSSAAFFIAAALLVPGSRLSIRGVGLNPTRSALLDFLVGMGARIRIPELESVNGELSGEIQVEYSSLRGGVISGGLTAALIDEIPVLAVLGAATEEGITVKDASELRIKETDRIQTVAGNLRRMGVQAEELPDGLIVPGRQQFRAAELDSFGDHRIAMAFAVAALRGDGESVIRGAEAASVSFPEFWDTLAAVSS
jgi:3-phosphoshikimate 1-carboxyvinyltransferase